jgi:hypothetical protein
MSPKPNRSARPQPARTRTKPQRDDEDEESKGGPLELMRIAVDRRLKGLLPSTGALALARERQYKRGMDLRCWNGKRSDRPECGHAGSQNVPVIAAATLGNWQWLVALARLWIAEGLLGRELGSNSLLYLKTVLDAMRWAATKATGDDLGALRTVIRAAVGWFAIGAMYVERRHSTVLSTMGQRRESRHMELRSPTAVNSGSRWTAKRDDGDAASVVVRAALSDPAAWFVVGGDSPGSDVELLRAVRAVIAGETWAAREIARHVNDGGWLLGTIDNPDVAWHWLVTRGDGWVRSAYFGPYPNAAGGKPCRSVTQLTIDGEWTSVEAMPQGWHVEEQGNAIVTQDFRGEVVLARPPGVVLWETEMNGSGVEFREGGR